MDRRMDGRTMMNDGWMMMDGRMIMTMMDGGLNRWMDGWMLKKKVNFA